MSNANRREFARIDVHLRARFRIVRPEEAEELGQRLQESPSVWAPEGESELMKLSTGISSGSEALMASAILDVARQVSKLTHQSQFGGSPAAVGEFLQLSASGGMFASHAVLHSATRLDLRLWDDDLEAPPMRMLAEILRDQPSEEGVYPLKFMSMHPSDQERLVRFLHALQRRRLRDAHRANH